MHKLNCYSFHACVCVISNENYLNYFLDVAACMTLYEYNGILSVGIMFVHCKALIMFARLNYDV